MTRVTSHPKLPAAEAKAAPRRDPALDRHSAPAGTERQDVSTFEVNSKHPAHGQTERVGVSGGPIHIAATTLYDGDGKPMATLGATTLGKDGGGINAGAITELKLPGESKPVTCVWAWDVASNKGPTSGWVPLSAVSPREKVEEVQRAIAQRISQVQGKDPVRHVVRTVIAPSKRDLSAIKSLYTFPHQTGIQNKAQYYFGGKTEEPLFLDVPKPGDSGRFGISDDAMPTGTAFHVDTKVPPERVPLYKKGASESSSDLRFVYGYFVNSGGEKRFGWINQDSLQAK